MIEAITYGFIAALCFIGFVSIIYYIILYIYRPKKCGTYILTIPENASRHKIGCLIYGAHLRNLLFGDLVCDDVIVFDNGLTDKQINDIHCQAKECGGIEICSKEKIIERLTENGRKSD